MLFSTWLLLNSSKARGYLSLELELPIKTLTLSLLLCLTPFESNCNRCFHSWFVEVYPSADPIPKAELRPHLPSLVLFKAMLAARGLGLHLAGATWRSPGSPQRRQQLAFTHSFTQTQPSLCFSCCLSWWAAGPCCLFAHSNGTKCMLWLGPSHFRWDWNGSSKRCINVNAFAASTVQIQSIVGQFANHSMSNRGNRYALSYGSFSLATKNSPLPYKGRHWAYTHSTRAIVCTPIKAGDTTSDHGKVVKCDFIFKLRGLGKATVEYTSSMLKVKRRKETGDKGSWAPQINGM